MSANEFSRDARPRLAGIAETQFTFRVAGGAVKMRFHINATDENGRVIETLQGDLEPYLTQNQIDTITTFALGLDTKARNALIEPVP